MPGEDDLTHQQALPQPPFHRQLFPECADRPTFQRLTNPAKVSVSLSKPECSVDLHESIVIEDHVVNMILTSGTNVKETMNSCEIQCPMEMSRKLLEWSHLLPTSVQDNRLAEELYSLKGTLPHLFVVGGLCEYGCETWNDVKIVGVPSFAETGTVAILTKDCEIVPLSFKICNFPLDL
jgi:DNA polymerase II small subunit/DNA polymerase delta subunit B